MAIDTNPVNVSGLAALAGRSEPRLMLQAAPIDAASAAIHQQNMQAQQGIEQQNANSTSQNANTNEQYRQMQVKAIQDKAQADAQQKDIKNRQAMDQDTLQKHQGALGSILAAAHDISTDTTLNDQQKAEKTDIMTKQALDQGYASGLVSKDEYKQLSGMPVDKRLSFVTNEFRQNLMAQQQKGSKGQDAMNQQLAGFGGSSTTQPMTPEQKAFTTAAATAQSKAVQGSQQQTQALHIVHDDAKDALDIIKNIPAGETGPVVDYLHANGMDSDIQKIQKLLSGIPIAVKAMYGVTPGNRLTTTELQQLNKASGSTAINKDALQWVLNRLIPQSEGIIHDNWIKEKDFYKNAGGETYKNWANSNPEPQHNYNNSSISQKSYQLNGKAFDMEAAKKATGLSEDEIVKQAGLK